MRVCFFCVCTHHGRTPAVALITASEVKRYCMKVTECEGQTWIANREPPDKNCTEDAALQIERVRNRKALVIIRVFWRQCLPNRKQIIDPLSFPCLDDA
jgi:hypothetical protein